ncbi:class I SAM-dependent methyltransferase [Sphingobium nicotianae]|uniref:Methyltransferase domain-containing protein n=1 Tax=Sphingobium nicotianae TaxID=2782607 RepID=A0A9X1AIV9_9SPHN|nr:class I SAM-dependent methyltransferase [Sphingobium nicotianae]MBT2185594.1 methyltransferase domain-containing protein [Sphingobium nicotianae]
MRVPHIFSQTLRARRRDRAARSFQAHDFLYAEMADEMLERLDDTTRKFARALVIGCPDDRIAQALAARGCAVTCADPGPVWAQRAGGTAIQEDALPYEAGSFDLILCCGTLDAVNDLPGALIAMNRALEPDGLLLVSFVGAGSLPVLRAALLAADGDRPAQRIHPQVDVRALGDLMARAGLAMPVADSQTLEVRYGSLFTLIADLRGMGVAQCLASAPPPLARVGLARAADDFARRAEADGRVTERFVIIHGSGWRPSQSQPQPARRGSATVSLAEALKAKR